MILVALDPSLGSSGLALFISDTFVSHATLSSAVRVKCARSDATQAMRAFAMADLLARQIVAWIGSPEGRFELATEWPQVYQAGKSKGDPNDLIGMAGVVGALIGLTLPTTVHAYKPGEWCKVTKVSEERRRAGRGPSDAEAFTSPRGLRIMSRLSSSERAQVQQSHDAVDAVGIGLHALGRFEPRRLYPGAVRSN